MAQEEIIFKVGVDTGDSANKVGTIEEQFDILKKTISDTEQEVEELTRQFGKNSQEVENARKKLGNLNASFNELKGAAINVNSTFEQVYGELQPLTTRLGEAEDRLYELSLAGKQNTKEYKELLETVARYKQTQIETDRIVDQVALTMTQKLGAAIQGAANGFMVVQGASALFGDESKELEKALLKVQAAMALAQGIEGVRQAIPLFKGFASTVKDNVVGAFTSLTTAQMANAAETGTLTLLQKGYALAVGTSTGVMKAFRIALASTGIGLLVVALGFLVEKMMSYMSSTDDATRAQDRFTASVKRYNDEQERQEKNLNDSIQFQLDYAKAVGASEEKQYQITKDGIAKREKLRQQELKDNEYRINYLRWAKQQAIEDENAELVKSINEEITSLKTKNNELIGLKYQLQREEKLLTTQHNTDLKKEQSDTDKETLAKQKEAGQKLKQQREQDAQEELSLKRKIKDLLIANIVDINKKEKEELLEKQKREREDLKKQYEDKKQYAQLEKELKIQQGIERKALEKKQGEESRRILLENQNKVLDDQKAILEAEIIKNAENFAIKQQRQLELENTDYEQKKLNAKNNKAQLELIEAQHTSNIKAINKEATDYQKMLDEELKNAKMSLVEQTSNMFGELASSAQQGSAIQKAFAVTQLTIDTAKSISSVIAGATAAAAAGGPAAPFLIGGYIASGIATVTKAMSTAKKLLNAPLPSVQPPSANRPTDNAQGTTQQGTQQTIQAQSTYKVVVVDSDITKMQDKTKKVNAISTI